MSYRKSLTYGKNLEKYCLGKQGDCRGISFVCNTVKNRLNKPVVCVCVWSGEQ